MNQTYQNSTLTWRKNWLYSSSCVISVITFCFQPIWRLQPYFKTDGIRNFIYTKHKGDNAKLRIFSFIPQTITYTTQFYELYTPNNQTTKHNPNNQNKDINVGSTTNTKSMLLRLRQLKFCYDWGNANSVVFMFKFHN